MEPEQKNQNEKSIKNTPEKIKVDEKLIKKSIGLLTVTAFVTSVAYLLAYWFSFGIDVFEFVDVSNIIAYSIIPLMFGIGAILYLGLIVACYRAYAKYKGVKSVDSRSRSFNYLVCVIFVSFFLVWEIVIALRYYIYWHGVTLAFALLLGFLVLFLSKRKKGFFRDHGFKIILCLIIIFVPIQSAVRGLVDAESIKRGDRYLYVEGTSISEEVRKWDDDKIRYIGTMSDYFFFLLPSDKSIYIAAKEEVKPLILKRYDRQKNKE